MGSNQNLKAYVRYDGSNRVVAGSLIFRRKKPTVGRWHEISITECCEYIPPTTTTTSTSSTSTSTSTTTTTTTSGSGTFIYSRSYWSNSEAACSTTTEGEITFYSASSTLAPGVAIFSDIALTTPVTEGYVISQAMSRYLVNAGGVLSLLSC
jgi:hypothetical protein